MRFRPSRLIAGLGFAAVAALLVGMPATRGSLAEGNHTQAGQTWTAQAGATTADSSLVTLAFYPQLLTVDVGDAITWSVAGEAHTVSFLSGAAPPAPLDPAATDPAGGTSYDGTGMVSSGLIVPANPGTGTGGPPSSYTLTFTAPGEFTFNCLIHPGMSGAVRVQAAGTAYPQTQAQWDGAALTTQVRDLTAGVPLGDNAQATSQANADGTTSYSVNNGIGNGTASWLRFLPTTLSIQAGDSVTWSMNDPAEVHTVTFAGPDGKIPDFPSDAAIAPAGGATEDGSRFTNSGIQAGPPGRPTNQPYTLTFPKAGVFAYLCLVHDDIGMKGTIIVH